MEKPCVIGMDIGGTWARIGAVALDGSLIDSRRTAVSALTGGGPETAVADVAAFIKDYISDANLSDVRGVAVAFPATVDVSRKVVYSASNLGKNGVSRFDGINIADGLQQYFDVPVFLGKDTEFILYSDIAALGLDDGGMTIGIYYGTGIGCSIYYHGETLYGRDGVAGEIGHLPISETGNLCTCGSRAGCCESVASGWRLKQICEQYFPDTPLPEIFERHADEPVVRNYINDQARIIALCGNLLNCAHYVIGGGIVEMSAYPKDLLRARAAEMLRHPYPRDSFDMRFSPAKQDAGIIGAARYVFRKTGMDQ